ncbi:MAG: 50S ribosomal protein L1 [Chloroflexota bacterium]|nr:50S ribosomal protein L1 [Chloroflexota bacterium]
MRKHGKKYVEAAKLVDANKMYSPQQAVELIKKTAYTKFNATVELHLKLGVDVKQADQMVRGVTLLPNGTGKQVRILVFAEGDAERVAKEAGADTVGGDELIKQIEGGFLEFDVAVAVPQMMAKVGRLGKILGTRGLMPSPKAGTIIPAEQLPRLIKELRLGRVEFRTDKTGNIHTIVGKSGFTEEQLFANLTAMLDAIMRAKPAAAKGQYIKKVVVASTMGPGIKLDPNEVMNTRASAA